MYVRALFALLATAVCTAKPIDYDKVVPFAQPQPVTISEKIAVRFNPTLDIDGGCYPYPAVNAAGEITGGLKPTMGKQGCLDPPAGSQVYGRATWHNDRYAIMFAWYFPKAFTRRKPSKRHDWANVVIWIDNPTVELPSVLQITVPDDLGRMVSGDSGQCFDGLKPTLKSTTPHFVLTLQFINTRTVTYCHAPGSSAPLNLIMWDQLTEAARNPLNTASFDGSQVPFNEPNFAAKLDEAAGKRPMAR
ncbi:necrosis inducing-like protein NPP1 type [Phytophthora sojae]|uniref:Necrosis inducing-like protein NPP1 type n=1 Tax=Phytophthora sojae (strain P6497) TaxID=1094619 RepID=G4YXM3_PHYSP|nr:necrosis inducing-like protein NPP1 type [Phytophthora sojae]EGZ24512.1 necrosis inducing-like protein NPP1 type [Phytophthora sojae]|eukprot:XP_009519800.1 necrosis inducing-like protein NPP1 type [Phytophthora sojae]